MKYYNITELKLRILLILINLVIIANTGYFYKHILLFLLIKQLIYNEFINFYLITTNILELLSLYFNIISMILGNILFYYIIYNFTAFLNYALYKEEYKLIKLALYLWLIINTLITVFIIFILFPIIWGFFKYYQQTFIINLLYSETKISEYYSLYSNIYLLIKYCLIVLISTVLIFKNYLNRPILIKLRKISLFIIISLLTVIGDILLQSVISIFSIICYELGLFYITYKKYYITDKIGLEPIILNI